MRYILTAKLFDAWLYEWLWRWPYERNIVCSQSFTCYTFKFYANFRRLVTNPHL